MLIATAAVAPLVIYGAVSLGRLRAGIQESVQAGNIRVAEQVASQIKLYIDTNARVLRSVGAELEGTRLAAWQQSRVLKNHALEFPEFREISLFDPSGRLVATSRIGAPATRVGTTSGRTTRGVHVSPFFEDEDTLPALDLMVGLHAGADDAGWLVARLSLEELWRFVDKVRVGAEGFALVISDDGRIVAHGDPAQKRQVALAPEAQQELAEIYHCL
jgi:hypothetical protein